MILYRKYINCHSNIFKEHFKRKLIVFQNNMFQTILNTFATHSNSKDVEEHRDLYEDNKDDPIIWPHRVPAFGEEMRQEFLLDENVTFLNHCGKGAVPRIVHLQQIRLLGQFERNPEFFLKVTRDKGWKKNIAIIAQFVGSDVNNLAFVENTTRGICNILKSYPYNQGDAILYNNKTHAAIKNQIEDVMESNKKMELETLELQLSLPACGDDILEQYELSMREKPNIKLAVIDYVCGAPATMFPIQKLIKLCHKHDVDVLVDGAHAPGLVPLNLEELGADFFVGNLHKWLFCPRGCAIQYVAPKYHQFIKPCVPSFDFKEAYPKPFMDQGTRNEGPYLCVEAAVGFYNWVGGYAAIYEYNSTLIKKAAEMLTLAWGTSAADYIAEEVVPFIRNIKLPVFKAYSSNRDDCKRLRYDLYYRFHIWAGIFLHDEDLWVRISSQIYCSLKDYEKLMNAILVLMKEEKDDQAQEKSRRHFETAVFSGP